MEALELLDAEILGAEAQAPAESGTPTWAWALGAAAASTSCGTCRPRTSFPGASRRAPAPTEACDA